MSGAAERWVAEAKRLWSEWQLDDDTAVGDEPEGWPGKQFDALEAHIKSELPRTSPRRP
jgi:hypothetical protein